MKKKKSKKRSKKKSIPLKYKLFALIGGLFHLIVFLLYDITFYNKTLSWLSLLICGIVFGLYFIKKMSLLNPNSYRKIKGVRLKAYMLLVCFLMILGGSIVFGNVINGTIIGLNYLGKGNKSTTQIYKIQKITKHRSGTRKKMKRVNPMIYLEKNGTIIKLRLSETYIESKNYSEFKKIEMSVSKGLLGFEIMNSYQLKK